MTIKYNLSSKNRYEIRFPYNLKQHFKNTFKSAKWDPEERCWHIGGSTANLNKLKAWIESVSRPNFGAYRHGHPDDMDIPVWSEEHKCWYDAEYMLI